MNVRAALRALRQVNHEYELGFEHGYSQGYKDGKEEGIALRATEGKRPPLPTQVAEFLQLER